ncbi:hypothetical protein [Acidovorax delafieldii]|uniref:hypothetical protein n=1 Tax=Acidovorax delafieldii TaxID=47920 RepID=UPI003ECC9D43
MSIRNFLSMLFGSSDATKQEEPTAAEHGYARLENARQWLDRHQSTKRAIPDFDDKRTPDMLDDAHDPTQSHLPFNIFNHDR